MPPLTWGIARAAFVVARSRNGGSAAAPIILAAILLLSRLTRGRSPGWTFWHEAAIVETGQPPTVDPRAEHFLNRPNQRFVRLLHERSRFSSRVDATGATDAVCVGVDSIGHIEVDHVRDALHVYAARSNVSGD